MADSVFTKIIKGLVPCHKIYEDDQTIAFLDIHPIQPGHTIIVPKKQVEFVWDLPDKDYQALTDTTKKVALSLRKKLNAKFIGQKIMGVDVPHAHVHLIPFNNISEYNQPQDMAAEPDHDQLSQLADKLKF